MAWFIVIIILLIALIGVLPLWPYSRSWGVLPGGIVLIVLAALAVLIWLGVAIINWPWSV